MQPHCIHRLLRALYISQNAARFHHTNLQFISTFWVDASSPRRSSLNLAVLGGHLSFAFRFASVLLEISYGVTGEPLHPERSCDRGLSWVTCRGIGESSSSGQESSDVSLDDAPFFLNSPRNVIAARMAASFLRTETKKKKNFLWCEPLFHKKSKKEIFGPTAVIVHMTHPSRTGPQNMTTRSSSSSGAYIVRWSWSTTAWQTHPPWIHVQPTLKCEQVCVPWCTHTETQCQQWQSPYLQESSIQITSWIQRFYLRR